MLCLIIDFQVLMTQYLETLIEDYLLKRACPFMVAGCLLRPVLLSPQPKVDGT